LNLTSTNLETPPGPPAAQEEPLPPVWLQRLFALVYVLFCMVLGLILLTLPWRSDWFETGWILHHPVAQAIVQHAFVRGAISGLGLVDIFLGVLEAVSYHDRR
jgi:hypothetical protein